MKCHTLWDTLWPGLIETDEMVPHWTSSVIEGKDSTDGGMVAVLWIISLAPIVSKTDISQTADAASMSQLDTHALSLQQQT